MTTPDLLRPSRDGDQFHYTWAARQSLRLLDRSSGLHALFVEAVDPSEHSAEPVVTTTSAGTPGPGGSVETPRMDTGDQVIDLAEYWGSSHIDEADRIVYRQFKHSTRHAHELWTMSFLTKTLLGFANKYHTLLENHPASAERVEFEFISNRAPATSARETLTRLRNNTESARADAIRTQLADILTGEEIGVLCRRLRIDDRAPSLLRLRHLLDIQVSDLLPGAPGEQALLLREMVSSRATSIAGANPAIRRADVLVALKTSEDQLLPAPNLISPPKRPIPRRQFADIAERVRSEPDIPTVVHGPGGVGKSVLAAALDQHASPGSVTIVFDCFGNGSYRRPSAPRHQAKQGFVQLANELAARALCNPLVPSATADDADYARAFLHRLSTAAETMATSTPGAILTIVIDAADNAALIAAETGDRSFVKGLIRERLPSNARLIVTCRTERLDRIGLPARHQDIPLDGFDLEETRAHLAVAYPNATSADAAEFHARTSHNPRVQTTVLDATSSIYEALAWLGPNPASPTEILDSLIQRQVEEVRDRQHHLAAEIDQICVGLAALRPMIPVRVLAELANVHKDVVSSFVADLGRPLLIDGGTVQFRDEPTETWFRRRYRPTGKNLNDFLARLRPIADNDAYVAASLPALLFEADRFDDLVNLALSDDALPDNALPVDQRNEVQRLEIAQQRTHFALTAALRGDHDFEAATLALRLGALTAGRTRRLDLIRDNTDLAARFLDPHVLEHLVATRSLTASWPNSNLPIEGALLAGTDGQGDQARNRLRSAASWMSAWTMRASRDGTRSGLEDLDIVQVAWGLLNTDGAQACVRWLRSWRPRTLAFDVGVIVARRLADLGRMQELAELGCQVKGRHLKFAIAQVCAERDIDLNADIVRPLLRPLLRQSRPVRPSRRDDYYPAPDGELVHGGLTAVIWLLTRACIDDLIDRSTASQILRRYLPENLGYRTGAWHDRDIWQLILGFALLAWLESRELNPTDIEGPDISRARERESFESSAKLRTYRADVEPLVSWAVLWLELQMAPTAARLSDFGSRAAEFLQRQPARWRNEEDDKLKVNTVIVLVLRVLARYPNTLDPAAVLAFQERNRDSLYRRTLTLLTRQAASNPALHPLASELARRCHEGLARAREDARELADDYVRLARATYRISPDEAAVHFQAALKITDAIGDDAWSRWQAFLTVADLAARDSPNQAARAYRLGQIAESMEPYLGDHLNYAETLSSVARLSMNEALALGSRWRDRRVASLDHLVEALATKSDLLLRDDPVTALALLPFGDWVPVDDALTHALTAQRNQAANLLTAVLGFRRARPLSRAALDQISTRSGVPRETIADVEDSLALSPSPVAGHPDDAEEAHGLLADRSIPPTTFDDLDLSTVDGWAKGLSRARENRARRDLFNRAAQTLGATPQVLRAFGECPTVDPRDLDSIISALAGQQLSMASQQILDNAMVALLSRLAPDYLLVPWGRLDLDSLRRLTGRDTDYERVASRALANQRGFTPEQAFALAAHIAERLDNSQALMLFDNAAGLFEDISAPEAHDGNHPDGTASHLDRDAALACLVWAALADPAGQTRWRAAHSVHLLLALDRTAIARYLVELSMTGLDAAPFLDHRLEFYERHARQWLLFGIARATTDPLAQASAAMFVPLLKQTIVEATPHAVNTPLARDSLIRLQQAGHLTLTDEEQALISAAGEPIGVVPRETRSSLHTVGTLHEITVAAPAGESALTHASPSDLSPREQAVQQEGNSTQEDDDGVERFSFFFDFQQYWCDPLGDAFGLTASSIETLVAEVLIDRWGVRSHGEASEDPRHELGLYPESNHQYKSDWPDEDDLDFYLAIQGLYEVAGLLLKHLPVVQDWLEESPDATGRQYTRFVARHLPSRADGRWLADRRDAPPVNAVLRPALPIHPPAVGQDSDWMYEITSDMFTTELFPALGHITVWGSRRVQDYTRSETVRVTSALVTPATAPALLHALQTAPNWYAYRIPDATDRDYSSTVPGFELTGWIDSHSYAEGADGQDPFAAGVNFPPTGPAVFLEGLDTLVADADLRTWRENDDAVMFSRVWNELNGTRPAPGSSGETLVGDQAWLATLLSRLDRWLIVEVQIERSLESSRSRQLADVEDNEDKLRNLELYTRYFLLDATGATYDV